MKHIKKIKIDIDKKNFEVTTSVQYDSNTRFLHIHLLNSSIPFDITGCSVKISGTKPDGTAIFNNCTIVSAKEGFIEVELTEQMNAVPGTVKCELKIYDRVGVLTTKQFEIEVTASVTSKSITSSDEFKALTDALAKVNNIDTKFESLTEAVVKDATEKEIQKQIATGNMANLAIADGSITIEKLAPSIKLEPEYSYSDIDINKFIKENRKTGGYYNYSTGKWVGSSSYCSTELIFCKGCNFILSNKGGNIAFWDEGQKFISGFNKMTDNDKVPIPANAVYITHSVANTNLDVFELFFDKSTSITLGEQYKISEESIVGNKMNLLGAFNEYTKPSENIFDNTKYKKDCYYDVDGTLKSLSNYSTTDLIRIEGDTVYTKLNTGGKVTFWDIKEKFISGEENNTNSFTPPSNARYVRISFMTANLSKVMIVKGIYDGGYIEYKKGVLKSDMLELTASNFENNDTREIISSIVETVIEATTPKIKVNPATPLNIQTYEGGQNQPTHPKVLYFKNGWNGYKYWMVYTPYPGNNSFEENPCICYSNDGVNWSEEGISNPIIRSEFRGCWYSDVHLVYRQDTSILELWVRYCSNGTDGKSNGWEGMYRLKSTDGVNWSDKEYLYHTIDTSWSSVVSPAIIYDDNQYKIWLVYKRQCLKYYTSEDGLNWKFVRDIEINPSANDPYKVWHIDVIKSDIGYEFVGCYQYQGAFDKQNFIYYSFSEDNVTYSKRKRILGCGYEGRFDHGELYRPCICVVNEGTEHKYYNMYYGAQGKLKNWAIGLVQASDIASLSGYIKQD